MPVAVAYRAIQTPCAQYLKEEFEMRIYMYSIHIDSKR
jgi:hypothetical protein